MSIKNHITVIVQTTNSCNLHCSYCYIHGSKTYEQSLTAEMAESLIYNTSASYDSIDYCWHGGEPLLAGLDFYKQATQIQKEIAKKRKVRFQNLIQTNLTLLSEEWLDFFTANQYRIGTSLDAPLSAHIHNRIFPDQTSSWYVFQDKLLLLKKYNVPLQALCVISKENVNSGREIFEQFTKLNATSYALLPLMSVNGNKELMPTNEELYDLYKTTFELWLNQEKPALEIQPIREIVNALITNQPHLCNYASSCLKRMISIAPNGDVLPCGSFYNSEYKLGNIFQQKLIHTLHSVKTSKLKSSKQMAVNENCLDCDYLALCRGGCREAAYWYSGSYTGKFPFCEARKKIFEYIKNRLAEVVEQASIG